MLVADVGFLRASLKPPLIVDLLALQSPRAGYHFTAHIDKADPRNILVGRLYRIEAYPQLAGVLSARGRALHGTRTIPLSREYANEFFAGGLGPILDNLRTLSITDRSGL